MSPTPDEIAAILARLDEVAPVEVSVACEQRAFVGTRLDGESLVCLFGEAGPRCLPARRGASESPLVIRRRQCRWFGRGEQRRQADQFEPPLGSFRGQLAREGLLHVLKP